MCRWRPLHGWYAPDAPFILIAWFLVRFGLAKTPGPKPRCATSRPLITEAAHVGFQGSPLEAGQTLFHCKFQRMKGEIPVFYPNAILQS